MNGFHRFTITAMLIAFTVFATGCSGTHSVRAKLTCDGGSSGFECEAQAEYEYSWKNTAYSPANFDAALVRLNVSESNIAFASSSGWVLVSILEGSSTRAAASFQWRRQGGHILAVDPNRINAWVQQHGHLGDSVSYAIRDIGALAHSGANVFTAVVEYGAHSPVGDSDSLYLNEADLLRL